LDVENELLKMIKDTSNRESGTGAGGGAAGPSYSLDIKMKNFNPPSNYKVNLFKGAVYFNNYETLYSEISKVNKQAKESLD
jgi:hypothetical protein